MMEAKIIKHNPEDVHAPAGGYAHVARYKDLIFISGQFGFDREGNLAPDAKSQAMQAVFCKYFFPVFADTFCSSHPGNFTCSFSLNNF